MKEKEIMVYYKTSIQITPDEWKTFNEMKKFQLNEPIKNIVDFLGSNKKPSNGYAQLNVLDNNL